MKGAPFKKRWDFQCTADSSTDISYFHLLFSFRLFRYLVASVWFLDTEWQVLRKPQIVTCNESDTPIDYHNGIRQPHSLSRQSDGALARSSYDTTNNRQVIVNPSGAEAGTFRGIKVNTMAADARAPCVARLSQQ